MGFKVTPRGLVVGLIEDEIKVQPTAAAPADSAPVEQVTEKKRTAKAAPKRGK